MIHNNFHKVLLSYATHQGWNEDTQIFHLVGFLNFLPGVPADQFTVASISGKDGTVSYASLMEHWKTYLQTVANEENESAAKLENDELSEIPRLH